MLMSSMQFASQIFMASTVLKMGIVKRKKPADLSWQQYFIQGAPICLCPAPSHGKHVLVVLTCFLLNVSEPLLSVAQPLSIRQTQS